MAALVESFWPDTQNGIGSSSWLICADWAVAYQDKLENLDKCARCLKTATEHNVPAVLSAQYLASPECDELSLVTYLSGFHKAVVRTHHILAHNKVGE